jgi:tyrosyl-tRNA synthetase
MSQPDENIPQLFIDCTYVNIDEIAKIANELKGGDVNPRDIKARLAFEITKIYHGEKAAKEAEEAFEKTFAKGGVPDGVLEVILNGAALPETMAAAGIVGSRTEWRRLFTGGAVKIMTDSGEEKIEDPNWYPKQDTILKIGKRRFVKVIV